MTVLIIVELRSNIHIPMRKCSTKRIKPFRKACFTCVDLLTTTYQTNNNSPVLLSVHSTNQKLGFTVWKIRHAFLCRHKSFDHAMSPSSLRFIEYSNTFRRNIIVANERIAILMNDLNKCRGFTQRRSLCNSLTTLFCLLHLVSRKRLLQNRNKRKVSRKKYRVFSFLCIGTLNCNIQTNKRFTCTRNTCYKANSLSLMLFAIFNNFVNRISCNSKVFSPCIASCDF